MTELYAVPDPEVPEFGDGGGGGGDDEMQELAWIACKLVEAAIARTDWESYLGYARGATRDDTDAELVVGLMKLAAANIEVSLELGG